MQIKLGVEFECIFLYFLRNLIYIYELKVVDDRNSVNMWLNIVREVLYVFDLYMLVINCRIKYDIYFKFFFYYDEIKNLE